MSAYLTGMLVPNIVRHDTKARVNEEELRLLAGFVPPDKNSAPAPSNQGGVQHPG